MTVVTEKKRRDVADELIDCMRGVTLEKYVKHTLIIHMENGNRYEIFARIIEDLGKPVYLYDFDRYLSMVTRGTLNSICLPE